MTLKLRNNLTKIEYSFENLEDVNISRLYYVFDITLFENMDDGEYAYQLFDDENVVATGIIQVGDFVPANNQTYTAQTTSGYIQYNPEN